MRFVYNQKIQNNSLNLWRRAMKFFNTVGRIDPKEHYFLSHRLDWDQLEDFIEKKYYFLLHAPRQSGKTTAIIEFVRHLNSEGKYTALFLSTESARTAVNDVKRAIEVILKQCRQQIPLFLPEETVAINYLDDALKKAIAESGVYDFLYFWSQHSKKPLILFFDEFDVLAGDSLITMLTQFRTGHNNRPTSFPQSICLIGVRDLRDYKVKTKIEEDLRVLYSPFNVKAESILLPNFSEQDVKTLYLQHTQETGQKFTDEAMTYAFEQTQGQPWLVNALAYQACFRDVKDRSITITKDILERAREALIIRRDTHLDALTDRLKEERVCNIIDSIISGGLGVANPSADDLQYVRDLGLITLQGMAIANPIYQEIIPRALFYAKQEAITQNPLLYKNHDGSFNTMKMLKALTEFFQESSEMWKECFEYKESGPHLLTMAFLQRVVNGGGIINREYALGTKRVDLVIKWQQQRIVIELKVLRGKETLPKGLEQTAMYMDKCNATEGHLIIFDPAKNKSWEEKIYQKTETFESKTIYVWGM